MIIGSDIGSVQRVKRENEIDTTNLWNTARVEETNKLITSGAKVVHTPYFKNMFGYKKPGLIFQYTDEEVEEIRKCKEDCVYFAENYCYTMTDDGIRLVKLYPHQIRVLRELQNHQHNIYVASRQTFKCLNFNASITIKDNKGEVFDIPIGYLYLNNKGKLGIIEKIKKKLYSTYIHFKPFKNIILHIINFIESFEIYDNSNKIIDNIELPINTYINSNDGFMPLVNVFKTKPFIIYRLSTENNYLESADKHLVFTKNGWKYVMDLTNSDYVLTNGGYEKVMSVIPISKKPIMMYDVSVDSKEHSYYSNNILSHNTSTSAFFMTWYLTFNFEKNILVVANRAETMQEIVDKIGIIYVNMPFFLKPGITEVNKRRLDFDNDCRIIGQSTTTKSALGFNIHLLYMDEFAHIPKHIIDTFYQSVQPTISASKIARTIITSTPNGMNLFWRLYNGALLGKNDYNPIKVDWWEIPERDEAWKLKQIENLGSEAAFNQEYGNQFLNSSELLVDDSIRNRLESVKKEFKFVEIESLEGSTYSNLLWDIDYDINFKDDKFVLSIDIADGVGGDYTVINIFKVEWMNESEIENVAIFKNEFSFVKLRQVGILRDNGISVNEVTQVLERMVTKLFNMNNILVVPEMNFKGDIIVNKLLENPLVEEFIFLHTHHSQAAKIRKIGINTQSKNKTHFISLLNESLKYNAIDICEKETLMEVTSFGFDNGKYTSQVGHDDIVMSCVNLSALFDNIDWIHFIDVDDFKPDSFIERKIQEKLNQIEYDVKGMDIFEMLDKIN